MNCVICNGKGWIRGARNFETHIIEDCYLCKKVTNMPKKEFSNNLINAQLERLAMATEESAEVIQIIGKIIKHGFESYHPDFPIIDNRELLEKEIADFLLILNLMHHNGDISLNAINVHMHQAHREKNHMHFNDMDFEPLFFKLKK